MQRRCEGKTVLVTGGGSGIGKAAALLFAKEGARVVIVDRNEETALQTASEIARSGGDALGIRADVSKSEEVSASVDKAVETFGSLHASFNAAGVPGPCVPIGDIADMDWAETIAVNLTGTFLCMKYQIGAMLGSGGGAIVNMSSAGILKPVWTQPDYQATKAGILALTRSAALNYGPRNIRVNAILPGVTRTPLLEGSLDDAGIDALGEMMPIRRVASSQEIAATAVWLTTSEAAYVTGTGLVADGGMQLT
ncbi:short chain dehydrogenase [Novosphingobium marinum]|uniref:NAD(P)-dependent dehydrogenase (Short-subunit alcohol dehydrogenase family) n=1 Tax=Novosphingobium marinum TaxID=1514948 RepID=A0A7Z0BVM4_9SPHN|nr:SDR family NAD(P)-dependent oxidoreductase [Novosphingobium marinum]NYH95495.1 NAD(P)-dependent dehydrogenase (short-subunit alcohol dehydrogenase family) [Novosphingobium marinum]GGC27511.1 short chain dehydrogenase [Novosphingobium marinum]